MLSSYKFNKNVIDNNLFKNIRSYYNLYVVDNCKDFELDHYKITSIIKIQINYKIGNHTK